MGWDYFTYQVQPDEFLIDVWAMLRMDVRKEYSSNSTIGNIPQQGRSHPQIRRAPRPRPRRY